MAASSPRKAPARKAPAKRTPPKPRTREDKVADFEEFRRRANGMAAVRRLPDPVEIGKDQGFDPPLVARWPEKLADQILLDSAASKGQTDLILLHLLGREQATRVAAMFAPYPDSDALVIGLVMYLWERFLGPGVNDVPGGTAAS